MSAFQRKLDIIQFIPRHPRKVTSRQILTRLKESGHDHVDMRTVQRDLSSLVNIGLFGLEVDKRSKPYGWYISACFKKLNLSLMDSNTALAFRTLEQSGISALPNTTVDELKPYFEKARLVLAQDPDSLHQHWIKSISNINPSQPLLVPDIEQKTLNDIKSALFFKKQINAEIKRLLGSAVKPVWKRYDRINPIGLLSLDRCPVLICTFGSMHKKQYSLPVNFIKNVMITGNDSVLESDSDLETIVKSKGQSLEEISLKMLIDANALFLLHDYKLAEDQTICASIFPGKVMLMATVKNDKKLRAFLRGLGDSVEIIEPAILREYFTEVSRALHKIYVKDSSSSDSALQKS